MIIFNEDNTRLIELMDGLSKGITISQTFRGHSYEFHKEGKNIIVRIDSETIGHLFTTLSGAYEQLGFEDWDNDTYKWFEWLDELDAYKFNYEV